MFQLHIIESPKSHLRKEYVQKYGYTNCLVETGTYLGDTVQLALEGGIKKIHSIELNLELYEQAYNKFKFLENIVIWFGDSISCLPTILKTINEPVTFWLDAHASGHLSGGLSGGSPIIDELKIIGNHHIKEHTIFIDDRRLFGSSEWSGVVEKDAIDLIKKINENYKFISLDGHIPGDILCATLKVDDDDENYIVW